jgi:hypothetical protein
MSDYVLQDGCVFAAPVGHGWRYLRDSKWRAEVISALHNAPCLGFRDLGGATCAVFRSGSYFYAQTCVTCHVAQEN